MYCYIIAEIGPNHQGDLEIALDMIGKIAKTGVDAIKFQLGNPEQIYSLDAFKPIYQGDTSDFQSVIDSSKKNQLSFDQHFELYKKCKSLNIDYLCSGFDIESMIFLNENFNLPYIKIPSGEIFSIDIINYISTITKPVILSTGMATIKEIGLCIELINKNITHEITLLHCVSNYPAPFKDINLKMMDKLRKIFDVKVGFSDHTIGIEGSIAAATLGASIIEKHITLDKSLEGPDHKASIEIKELEQMVNAIRNVNIMIGEEEKILSNEEEKIKKAVRKSCVTKNAIKKDQVIKRDDICFKRPGTGILPIHLDKIIGKKAIIDIDKNRVIKYDCLSND